MNSAKLLSSLLKTLLLVSTICSSAFAEARCIKSTAELEQVKNELPAFMRGLPAYFITGEGGGAAFTLTTVGNDFRGILFYKLFGNRRGELYAKNICFNGNNLSINLMDGASFSGSINGNVFIANTVKGDVKMWATTSDAYNNHLNKMGVSSRDRQPTR